MKQTYCVWKDNLLEEIFAIEKIEFEQSTKLKDALNNEKNTIYTFDAQSMTEAISLYKQLCNNGTTSPEQKEQTNEPDYLKTDLKTTTKKFLH